LRVAGNKSQFQISVDNQRFILQELRDFCGKLQKRFRQFFIQLFAAQKNKIAHFGIDNQ